MREGIQPESQAAVKLTNAEQKALNNLFIVHQDTVTSLLQKLASFYDERERGDTRKSIGTAIMMFFEVLWFAIKNPGTVHELIKFGNSLSDEKIGEAKLEAVLSNDSIKAFLKNKKNREALGSLAVTFGQFTQEQRKALKGGAYAVLELLADQENYKDFIEIAKDAIHPGRNDMAIAEKLLKLCCKSDKMKKFFKDHHGEVGKLISEFGNTPEAKKMLEPYGISEDLLKHSGLFLEDIEKVHGLVKSLNNDGLFVWAEKGVGIINNNETLKKFIQENPQVITNIAKGIAENVPPVKEAMEMAACHPDVLDILTHTLKDTQNAEKFLNHLNKQEFVNLAQVGTKILADNQDLRQFFKENGKLLTPIAGNIVLNQGDERLHKLPLDIITKSLETLFADEDFAKTLDKTMSALPKDGEKLNLAEVAGGAADLLRSTALREFVDSNKADIEKAVKIGLEVANLEKGSPIDKVLAKVSIEKILDGTFVKNSESFAKLLDLSKPLLEETAKEQLNMKKITADAADFLESIEQDPEIKKLIVDNKAAVKEILREIKDVAAMKVITSCITIDNAVDIFTQSISSLPTILRNTSAQLPDDLNQPMGFVDMAKTGWAAFSTIVTDTNMLGIAGAAVSRVVSNGIYGNHITVASEDLPVFQAAFENNDTKNIENAKKLLMNAIGQKNLDAKYHEIDIENIYFPKGQELNYKFKNCNMRDISIHNATFIEPHFANVIFDKSHIVSSKLKNGKSDKAVFFDTEFQSSTLENMQFKTTGNLVNNIKFTDSSLEGVKFEGYNFRKFECNKGTKIQELEFIGGKLSDLKIEDNASVSKIICRNIELTSQAFKELKAMGEKVILEEVKFIGEFKELDLSGMKLQGVDLTNVRLAEGSLLNITDADLGDLKISEEMLKNTKGMLVAKFNYQGSEKLKEDRSDRLIEDFASGLANEIKRKTTKTSIIKKSFEEFTKLNNKFNNGEEISLINTTLPLDNSIEEDDGIYEDAKESLEPIEKTLEATISQISLNSKNHLLKALETNVGNTDKHLLLQCMADYVEQSGDKFNANGTENVIDAYAFAVQHGLEKNLDSIMKLDSEARNAVIKIGEGIAEQCFGKKAAEDDRANDRKGIIKNMIDTVAEFDQDLLSKIKRQDNLNTIVGNVVFSGLSNQFDKNQSSGLSALYYVNATNNPWTGKAALKPENLASMKDKIIEKFDKLNLRPGKYEKAEMQKDVQKYDKNIG